MEERGVGRGGGRRGQRVVCVCVCVCERERERERERESGVGFGDETSFHVH